ncbi:MAG: ABC transporter substrate-binding protein [Actinobacteria bacterium]|nr:ABC transporter substrate-binding protein [Actinomycetota bacterium]
MKWKSILIAPVAAAALVLSACTGTGGGGDENNTLRIGVTSDIDSMNPFVGINEIAYGVWMHIYPSLLQYDTADPKAPYTGSLAKDWKLSDDGLTLTFHLIEGATWSDGDPLNAEDVVWSLKLFHTYNKTVASGWSVGSNITSIKAPDENTVVLTMAKPSALALNNVATVPLLPEQVWAEHDVNNGDGLKEFDNVPQDGKEMVSGGPFIMTQYRKGELAVFKTNPKWYGTKPKISGFGLQTYKAADAMITALASGSIDAAGGVPPTGLKTLSKPGIKIDSYPALALRDFGINSNPKKKDNRELLNPDVRKAMEYAVDREEIVKAAWVGKASPGDSILPPVTATNGQLWYNEHLKTIGYDIDAANDLLDKAGMKRGADGIRLADDGTPMSYEVIFADDENGPGDRAFQIIKGDFKKIGIEITQRKLDTSATWDAIYCGDDCQYRDFDLFMWNWHPGMDPNFMMSAMTCEQWGSWNDVGYCNPEFDKLEAQQAAEVDPAKRKTIIDRMQQMIYDDRPYIILTYDVRNDAWSKNWDGFVRSTQGFFNSYSTQTLEQVHRK